MCVQSMSKPAAMPWIRVFFTMGFLVCTSDAIAAAAGAVACYACITTYCPAVIPWCMVVPPPGPGALLCMAAFCGVPCGAACASTACFDNSSQFTTPGGHVPVWSLKKGDLVLAEAGYTPVTDIGYVERDEDVFTFRLANGASLATTDIHGHFILEQGGIVEKQSFEIKVGMVMSTRDNTNGTILAIEKSVKPGKWSIATQPCNAYANGILTKASCSKIDVDLSASQPPSGNYGPQLILGKVEYAGITNKSAPAGNFGAHSDLTPTKQKPEHTSGRYVMTVDDEFSSDVLKGEEFGFVVNKASSWHVKKVEF